MGAVLLENVSLHWIKGGGEFKQFVKNRVEAIDSKIPAANQRHVPGKINPADIASRGCYFEKLSDYWWEETNWLPHEESWPEGPKIEASLESEAERKAV